MNFIFNNLSIIFIVLASAQKEHVRINFFISSKDFMSFINDTSDIFSFANSFSDFNLSKFFFNLNAASRIINCCSLSTVVANFDLYSSYSFFTSID